jgi:purine nucleosidase
MDDGNDFLERARRRAVLLDHDGGVDDLLSLVMLLSMPHVDLRGIAVTPADCFLRPALSATTKILRWFGRADVPVSPGRLLGVNAFPPEWRAAPYAVDALPILNDDDTPLVAPLAEPAHEFLARMLRAAREPVTVLVTGPVTNIAHVLTAEPELADRIDEVVWMGGALAVPGNVRAHEHDGSAEWNAYWDPPATARLWRTRVPITLVPLDATNQVPVSVEFLARLARRRRHDVADFAGQCWAMTVGTIPAYEYVYCMWDTLTAGYLGAPHLLSFETLHTEVDVDAPSAGRIRGFVEHGRPTRVATRVDADAFHEYLLGLLARDAILEPERA